MQHLLYFYILYSITGKVTSKTSAVYDATSGNMGSAEAYMCTLVGIPYFAVVSEECEQEKIDNIEKFGGKVIKVMVIYILLRKTFYIV